MKLRVRSAKVGKVRFTSHRDAARIWERALRRAQIPLASTEGFTPRPKISFGLALPTGAESIAEYTDLELRRGVAAEAIDLPNFSTRLSEALPHGFDVLAVEVLTEKVLSLQEAVTSCRWELWSSQLSPSDHEAACGLLEQDELILERVRKGKRSADDVRPKILNLRPSPDGGRLIVDLATTGRALRPMELASLAYPHIDPVDVRALRTYQWIEVDGQKHEVVALPDGVDASALMVLA